MQGVVCGWCCPKSQGCEAPADATRACTARACELCDALQQEGRHLVALHVLLLRLAQRSADGCLHLGACEGWQCSMSERSAQPGEWHFKEC